MAEETGSRGSGYFEYCKYLAKQIPAPVLIVIMVVCFFRILAKDARAKEQRKEAEKRRLVAMITGRNFEEVGTPRVNVISNEWVAHLDTPHNVGSLDPTQPIVGRGMVNSADCKTTIMFDIIVRSRGGRPSTTIKDIKFKSFGPSCSECIACCSLLSDTVIGTSLTVAKRLNDSNIEIGGSTLSPHGSLVAIAALKAAIVNLESKTNV